MSAIDKLRRLGNRLIINRIRTIHYKTTHSKAIRRLFHLKPILSYLEVHLVDHCNLDCRGCSHYSPLADEFFANIEQYDRDMKRLSQLMANIEMIRLLGGEPLLHPDLVKFFDSTRTRFPKTSLHLVTNGMLLSNMPKQFWESCRANRVSIDITLYPPLYDKETDLAQLAKNEGVTMNIAKTGIFRINTNSRGDSEKNETFRRCRKIGYWPLLMEGKVYPCSKPAYIHYFNQTFGTTIPDKDFVDLYDPKVTGWDVLAHIDRNPEICRYCTYGWEKVPTQAWGKSCSNQKEWDVAHETK